jgi:hypothetical protein
MVVPSKIKALGIGEGPEYRPFHDLRSVPEAGTMVLFLCKAELGFFQK